MKAKILEFSLQEFKLFQKESQMEQFQEMKSKHKTLTPELKLRDLSLKGTRKSLTRW
jgi:hypothetical protein